MADERPTNPYVFDVLAPSGRWFLIYRDEAKVTHTVGPLGTDDASSLKRHLLGLLGIKTRP